MSQKSKYTGNCWRSRGDNRAHCFRRLFLLLPYFITGKEYSKTDKACTDRFQGVFYSFSEEASSIISLQTAIRFCTLIFICWLFFSMASCSTSCATEFLSAIPEYRKVDFKLCAILRKRSQSFFSKATCSYFICKVVWVIKV